MGASLVMTGGSWGGGMVGVGGRPDVVCGILFLGGFMPDGSSGRFLIIASVGSQSEVGWARLGLG